MAQHDYVIANQGFPAFRSDLNDALAAIVSNNSGATEPTTMFAHQMWVDTAANPSVLKIRNADNDAWITIGTIDQTGDTFTLTSAVSATTLNTSGAVVFNDAGADVDFRVEGDTDANLLFVDASADRVGIGTTSPAVKFQVLSGTANTEVARFSGDGTDRGLSVSLVSVGGINNAGVVFNSLGGLGAPGTLIFSGGGTERMRIDSSGTVGIAGSGGIIAGASEKLSVHGLTGMGGAGSTTLYRLYILNDAGTTTSSPMIRFSTSDGVAGTIISTTLSTVYGTSSDYRLKENIAPMTGALAKVLELNPVTYTWKINGSAGQGFIAHELQEICPDAVTGEKDATEIQQVEVSPAIPATYDDEGNELTPAVEAVYEEREVPVYQGVDTSFLVATLTAAIQELKAELDEAKARIAALENA